MNILSVVTLFLLVTVYVFLYCAVFVIIESIDKFTVITYVYYIANMHNNHTLSIFPKRYKQRI